MSFDKVRAVADAILLEGYVLYPYRASAVKNRYRWAFGVLAPEAWRVAAGEPSRAQMECLVEGEPEGLRLRGLLRFLQVEARLVECTDEAGELREAESLDVGGVIYFTWVKGRMREEKIYPGSSE